MKVFGILLIAIVVPASACLGADYEAEYQARADSVIDYYAGLPFSFDAFRAMAKFNRQTDVATACRIVDSLTAKPRGDMFWLYPMAALYLISHDHMPDSSRQKIRTSFRDYTPYRGDTENHWVMYYTSMYLLAQSFPGEPGSFWFNGKSSDENLADAEGWLLHWMDLTTTIGQGEFDSPTYHTFFLTPCFLLHRFAQDEPMRTRAQIMIEWLLADALIDYLDGTSCGAHSRIYEVDIHDKHYSNSSRTIAFLLGDRPLFRSDGEPETLFHNTLITALCDYQMPDILRRIGTDRSQPYLSKERKRSRYRIRFYPERMPLVSKMLYMTPTTALGSIQKGHTEQILQHTWALNWSRERYGQVTTLFTLHPYYSARDMGSLFTSYLQTVVPGVVGSKTTYDKEEKWVGSSPYEELMQFENTLIGLYDLRASDAIYKHYNGFFPRDFDAFMEDESGWIFCRTGTVFIAFFPFKPYEWRQEEKGRRLRSEGLTNGFILEVKQPTQMDSFAAFQKQIKANPIEFVDTAERLAVSYRNLDSRLLEFTYGGERVIDGKADDPSDYALFDSPYVQAEVGSRQMVLTHGGETRILDLDKIEIRTLEFPDNP
ncbi:hypothetical protein JW992_10245 [candidate division KSB1 bacterium]|nr:hypothetical protein [candidate division KSB1 bacterium]